MICEGEGLSISKVDKHAQDKIYVDRLNNGLRPRRMTFSL